MQCNKIAMKKKTFSNKNNNTTRCLFSYADSYKNRFVFFPPNKTTHSYNNKRLLFHQNIEEKEKMKLKNSTKL